MLLTLAGSAFLMGLAGGPHCIAMCGESCCGLIRASGARAAPGMWTFQAGRFAGYTLAGAVAGLPGLEARSLLARVSPVAASIPLALAALGLLTGALDLALQVRRHRRSLRMTPEEVRRDHREEEGDPQHRAERRRRQRALAGTAPLRRAACVVVNPTHVAVALQHAAGSDEAPVVLAKAMGRAAADLRRDARRAGVPIVRHVHLARALYRLAEIGDEIPVELYDAAAAVLAHVYGCGAAREALP
jgi:flagellar biosynthesis protein FlhB